jgi:hypothetical protein
MTVWIVGRWTSDTKPWEVMGVYDSEEKAVAACKDCRYFVGPEELNVPAPDEPTPWPGCYYPIIRKAIA